jgi:hypothetical protein
MGRLCSTAGLLGHCRSRKTTLSAEMAKKRAKAKILVALIERNSIGGGEVFAAFETDSSAFGIIIICRGFSSANALGRAFRLAHLAPSET